SAGAPGPPPQEPQEEKPPVEKGTPPPEPRAAEPGPPHRGDTRPSGKGPPRHGEPQSPAGPQPPEGRDPGVPRRPIATGPGPAPNGYRTSGEYPDAELKRVDSLLRALVFVRLRPGRPRSEVAPLERAPGRPMPPSVAAGQEVPAEWAACIDAAKA